MLKVEVEMKQLLIVVAVCLSLGLLAASVFAAPPTAYTNIITNGDFSSAFNGWSNFNVSWDVSSGALELSAGASYGSVSQVTAYTAAANDPYNVTLRIGNHDSAARTLSVLLMSSTGSLNSTQCLFSIPAFQPLSTYRILTKAPGAWTNIYIILEPQIGASGIYIDDVNLQYWPAAQVTSTVCTSPPTPTPTPTPTPDIAVVWALPTQVIAGTPQPAQYVRFSYDFTAGEVAVSMLLAAMMLVLMSAFIIWLLIGRSQQRRT